MPRDQQKRRRWMRDYRARLRGQARCWKSEAEDAPVFVAFAAGALSEGQAMRILRLDRVTLREKVDSLIRAGVAAVAAEMV